MTPTISSRDADREKIKAEIAAYLKRGGKINVLPYGPDDFAADTHMTKKEKATRTRARKRAAASSSWQKQSAARFEKKQEAA